jgi:PKD repeat protein
MLASSERAFASGPVAAIESNASVPVGQSITFDASSSTYDPAHPIVDYSWDLDGSGRFATDTHTSSKATKTYAAPGVVKVGLRVTDSSGASSVATEDLTVTGDAQASQPPPGSGVSGDGGTGGAGPILGGDAAVGIAGLTAGDLRTIAVGSDNRFAAITGTPLRRASVVAAHGLWINVLADRSVTFNLSVSMPAPDARRLRLAGKRARGFVKIATATARLQTAGQRPFDVSLRPNIRSRLRKLHARVQLVVSGTAVDTANHSAVVSRAFAIRP